MKAPLPDLFDGDKQHSPAAQPLRSRKRETFCALVADECWGNQTEAYVRAFGGENRDSATAAASRLMRDPAIKARITALRDELIEAAGVDRLWILQKRKYIAENGRNQADKLKALEAIEKSLGLDTPIKLDISGGVDVRGVAGVLQIDDALEFARIMEAVRAKDVTAETAES